MYLHSKPLRLCDITPFLKLHFFSVALFRYQSLEKFSGQTTLVAKSLETFMRQIHDTEFPNSVEATEQLLISQGTEYLKLKVKLKQIV